jgi:hypothetical protein
MFRLAARVFLLVCVSFILRPCVSICQSSAPAPIVGRWRSLETSKGGIGAIYEFHSDGTADFSPGAVVEMPWRIENGQIVFPSATTNGPEQKMTLKWLGDNQLSLVPAGESSGVELTRVGNRSDPADPLIGEWIESREMDGHKLQAHWLLARGGKGLFLLPFVTRHGRYSITDSDLRIEIPDATPANFIFKLKEDVLILSKPQGSSSRYARF